MGIGTSRRNDVPPSGAETPPGALDAAEGADAGPDARALARLRSALTWLTRLALAVAAVESVLLVVAPSVQAAVSTAIIAACGAALALARRQLAMGRVERTVHFLAGGLLAGAFAYTLVAPGATLTLALLPFVIVGLGLPFLKGPALVRLAVLSWVAGVALIGLGLSLPPAPWLRTWYYATFRFASYAAVAAVAMLLLVHFSSRLADTLGQARRAHAELRGAHEQLRDLDRLKTRFLNSAAHELRTPMTPIVVQLELLGRQHLGPLNPRQQRAIGILDRNIARLNRHIDDLLDIARLQADQFRVARERVEVTRLVAEAAESFHEVAARAGVGLEVVVTPGLVAHADPRRLTQVLFNLLGNAMKFTPPGGRVTLSARRDGGLCVVQVRDTGVGFEAADAARLFLPFSQLHDDAAQGANRTGVGLGLYVCKGIVERHGGSIRGESDGPGKGATFTFTLPLEERAEAAVTSPSPAGRPPARA